MSTLRDRLLKNSTIKEADVLKDSIFFNEKDMIPTVIHAINIALAGSLKGGLTPGLTMWAGPSKHFKSLFSLICAKAYMDKYPDAVMIFYDSEFGTPKKYFESLNIDMSRIIHVPLANMEQFKFDIVKQLEEGINRGDKVVIVVDSVGNMASKKELDDTLEGKSTADMTRAKQLKSIFRMVTPYLTMKDIPMVVVNHTYKTMDLFPKDQVGGGTGTYYSSDNIFIIGRQQEKDGQDLAGWNFIINVDKSRHSKERSKIPVTVRYDDGISVWSGLLDMALESGHVIKPSNGWYSRVDKETGEIEAKKVRQADTNTKEFWEPIITSESFNKWVEANYMASANSLISDTGEEVVSEVPEIVLMESPSVE